MLAEKDSFGWGVHLDTRLQQGHSCLKGAVVDSGFRVLEKNFRFDFLILEVFGSQCFGYTEAGGFDMESKVGLFLLAGPIPFLV